MVLRGYQVAHIKRYVLWLAHAVFSDWLKGLLMKHFKTTNGIFYWGIFTHTFDEDIVSILTVFSLLSVRLVDNLNMFIRRDVLPHLLFKSCDDRFRKCFFCHWIYTLFYIKYLVYIVGNITSDLNCHSYWAVFLEARSIEVS